MLKDCLIRKTVSCFPATEKMFRELHRLKMKWNFRRHSRGVILLYHRVSDPSGGDPQLLCVSPENFRNHLKFLSEHFIPTPVSELLAAPGSSHRIAITFDDGYRDNLTNAAPILEEFNFPAEFFVATAGLEQKYEFYWDLLEQFFPLGNDWNVELEPQTENQKRYLRECSIFHNLNVSGREKRMEQLAAELNRETVLRDKKRFLTPEELSSLAKKKNITIGAHTNNHVSLAHLSEEEARREIMDSKRILEQLLERNICSFSYPFGTLADFSSREERLLEETGFSYGIANYESPVLKKTRYDVPRFLVRNWSVEVFAEKIKDVLP